MLASWLLRSTATAALAAMLSMPMFKPATVASAVALPTASTCTEPALSCVEALPRIRARFALLLSAMATFRPPERLPMLLLTDRDSALALLGFFSSPAVTLTLPA